MTDSLVARARVLAVHADGGLSLSVDGVESCPGCQCGRWLQSESRRLEMPVAQDLELPPGSELLVVTPVAEVLRGTLWLHGLPWALMVLGGAAAAAAGFGDPGCLLGMTVGLGAALLALRLTRHRWNRLAATALRPASTS
jgi:hypothetical protein